MLSYKLFLRVSPHAGINWRLTGIAYLFTCITMALNLLQPFLFSQLIDRVLLNHQREWLTPILSISLGAALLAAILDIVRDCMFRYLDICTTLNIREVVLAHLRKIPLTEIEKQSPGKFMPLLAGDAATMSGFLNRILVGMTIQLITMVIAVCMVFYMNWQLGVVALASIPLIMFIPRIFRKPLTHVSQHIRTHNEKIGTHLYECVQGSREIRAFGLEAWEKERNGKLYQGLIAISTKETVYRAVTGQASTLAISIIIVLLYGFGSGQVAGGTLTVGMLVAAVQYFNNALRPIQAMNNFFGDIKRSEVALARIEEFLQIPVETVATAAHTPPSDLRHGASAPDGGVDCRDLAVSYEGVNILKGVDFTVKPGQIAAFVGPSGSGKTTLLKTLMGFMPIRSGELSMLGRPFRHWTRTSLTEHVGMMFQESFIFAGTLYDNIALGDLAATEAEVYRAACRAGLKSYVDSLPHGLYTEIGNQGFVLSGGQRQRLAIARVVLKRPDLLILDEPTSALDRATEDEVLTALHEMMEGKTTLVSTHRLETVMSADVIYVLDQGKIIDHGTHAELIERCGIYGKLVDEQRSKHGYMAR